MRARTAKRTRSPRLPLALALVAGLLACADPEPPLVEASALGDTRDTLGPYAVSVIVRENREVAGVHLFYREAEAQAAEAVSMIAAGDRRYLGEIPGFPVGAKIHWFVEAEDGDGNFGYAPWQAERGDGVCLVDVTLDEPIPVEGAAYCFEVLP